MPKDHIDLLIENKISGNGFVKNITSHLSHYEILNILNDKEYCLKFLIQSLDATNKNATWKELAKVFIEQIVEDLFKIYSQNLKISIDFIFNLFALTSQITLYDYLHKIDINHKNEYLENLLNSDFKEPFNSLSVQRNHYISIQFHNLYVLTNKNNNQQNHANSIEQYILMHQLESKVTHF